MPNQVTPEQFAEAVALREFFRAPRSTTIPSGVTETHAHIVRRSITKRGFNPADAAPEAIAEELYWLRRSKR